MNNESNGVGSTSQPNIRRLIFINSVVAVFVLLANGSALFLGLTGRAPDIMANLLEVLLIVTGAFVVLSTAVLAIIKPSYQQKALAIHAGFLATGTVILMLWGFSLAVSPTDMMGYPKSAMTWSVGWLTALASYSVYLVTNTFLRRASSNFVKYAYLWIGGIVFFIDLFVFFRLASLAMKSA